MLKYEFEDVIMASIKEDLHLCLNEKEHKCKLSVDNVLQTIESSERSATFLGTVFVERLKPTDNQSKYIDIGFKVILDLNQVNDIKCSVNIEYQYDN